MNKLTVAALATLAACAIGVSYFRERCAKSVDSVRRLA